MLNIDNKYINSFQYITGTTLNNGVFTSTSDGSFSSYFLIKLENLSIGDIIEISFDYEGNGAKINFERFEGTSNITEWVLNIDDNGYKRKKYRFVVKKKGTSHRFNIGYFGGASGSCNVSNISVYTSSDTATTPEVRRDDSIVSRVFTCALNKANVAGELFKHNTTYFSNLTPTITMNDNYTVKVAYNKSLPPAPVVNAQILALGDGANYSIRLQTLTSSYCTFMIYSLSDNTKVDLTTLAKSLYVTLSIIAQ